MYINLREGMGKYIEFYLGRITVCEELYFFAILLNFYQFAKYIFAHYAFPPSCINFS